MQPASAENEDLRLKNPLQAVAVLPRLTFAEINVERKAGKLNTCCICDKPIKRNPIAIGDRQWHRKCFRCDLCHRVFAGSEYYLKDDCPLHKCCLQSLVGPFCARCSNPICDSDAVQFLGKVYHKNCLRCSLCQKVIVENEKIYNYNGIPLCSECIQVHQCICAFCGANANPLIDMRLLWEGHLFYLHSKCAICSGCGQQITRDNFAYEQGKVICKKCWFVAGKEPCDTCSEIILPGEKISFGGNWHFKCFKCHHCGVSLSAEIPNLDHGELLCKRCFESISTFCSACKDRIYQDPIPFSGRVFHPKCWNCSVCTHALDAKDAVFHNGKLYCGDCFSGLK